MYHASAAECWAFFLLNADKLSVEDISRIFPDQEFTEAAGVLEMISQTPEQNNLYNARLKFQRDEAARLALARSEGEAIGEARGEARGEAIGEARGFKMGRIIMLQELLGISPSKVEELGGYHNDQLDDLEDQLQQELRSRG